MFIRNYVQAHYLDLDFYDRFFETGPYLRTHAEHMHIRCMAPVVLELVVGPGAGGPPER